MARESGMWGAAIQAESFDGGGVPENVQQFLGVVANGSAPIASKVVAAYIPEFGSDKVVGAVAFDYDSVLRGTKTIARSEQGVKLEIQESMATPVLDTILGVADRHLQIDGVDTVFVKKFNPGIPTSAYRQHGYVEQDGIQSKQY